MARRQRKRVLPRIRFKRKFPFIKFGGSADVEKKDSKVCGMFANDIKRLGTLMHEGAGGKRGIKGAIFGPPGKSLIVDFTCNRTDLNETGQGAGVIGTCHTIHMTRSGPAAAKLGKKEIDVGNVYGLGTQLSRDLVRIWDGCPLDAERGFEGARGRRRRRR